MAEDKNGSKTFTTHILSSYANTFNSLFQDEKNLFDSADSGLPLMIPQKKPDKTDCDIIQNLSFSCPTRESQKNKTELLQFFKDETAALTELRSILTGETKLTEAERNNRIIELLKDREYLYLHFPDGWKVSTDIAFLKRVRAEIEAFIKIFGSSAKTTRQ